MELSPDFKELLRSFNSNRVEYLIVGGYALAWLGAPRFTGDLDFYVKPSEENAERVLEALKEFGFAESGLKQEDFVEPGRILRLGVPPARIDILTSIDGVTWKEAWAGRESGRYGDTPASYIGKSQFIANKRAMGRHKDLADIEALQTQG
jgi:hypothetical protein